MSRSPERRTPAPRSPRGTGATSSRYLNTDHQQGSDQPIDLPVGPAYEAAIAAQIHLQRVLGFPAGIPSPRQTRAFRSTRRFRHLVAHLQEPAA